MENLGRFSDRSWGTGIFTILDKRLIFIDILSIILYIAGIIEISSFSHPNGQGVLRGLTHPARKINSFILLP
jgi:hypothetical protein